jgi:hypothetical protein
MHRLSAVCVVLHVYGVLVFSSAEACTDAHLIQNKNAIVRFDVMELPASGMAEAIQGQVDMLVGSRWIPVRHGNLIANGTRLWIAPCAKLSVRITQNNSVEVQPQDEGRWLVVRIATQ